MATLTEEPVVAEHKPFVPDSARLPEFTWSAVIMGALLGIVFGASSLYLVLKVSMTVSASIPVAVLSITLFRVLAKLPFMRRANILENNIVQTAGSAGESIAFGVGVTMPALMLLGFEMDVGRVMVVSIMGGLLGILMMIPLRRAFIVKQHGTLKYPEGTACAEVLIVGEKGGATAVTVFVGFGIAFVFQVLRQGFKFFQDTVSYPLSWFKGATPSLETDPTLLGVGYIIGTKISCIMVAGGVLASFVLIPAIHLFGDGLKEPLYPGTVLISKMSEEDIHRKYVLYIGAGAVAAGGIISLFQALPLILSSFGAAVRDLTRSTGRGAGSVPRTDRDLPLWFVGLGSVGLVLAIWATSPLHNLFSWIPQLHMNLLGAVLIVVFGFLFVTVSSRLTGEIGSSSNPISGMTVATLLLTCLIFLAIGWTRPEDRLTALSIAGVVCIAASNGGTTSQDLKTGYLVGATPLWQQLAILVGALSSALVIGFLLIALNDAKTVYTKRDLPTPKKPIDVAALKETAKAPDDPTLYHVLRVSDANASRETTENPYGLPGGKFLVDDKGEIVYLVDPGINGSITHKDDGTEVKKFTAPKATLMAFITDGILQQKLPWPLVLLGASIAVLMELCGVPSLAFAVGVYLPLSTSSPIFVGGLARYVADRWGRSKSGPEAKDTDSDTSSGVLLSTGYIAGGAIAGLVVAFLNLGFIGEAIPKLFGMGDSIPNMMSTWQYTRFTVSKEMPLDEAVKAAAESTLPANIKREGKEYEDQLSDAIDEIKGMNSDLLPRYFRLKAKTTLKFPDKESVEVPEGTTLGEVALLQLNSESKAQDLLDRNIGALITVPAGTTLKLPGSHEPPTYDVKQPMTLGEAAAAALGQSERALKLFEANRSLLTPKITLPAGAQIKVPQLNWPALASFGVLVLLMIVVGLGWILRTDPMTGGAADNGVELDTDRSASEA
jgi:putative OPT family oligopeptide transporter